MHLLRNITILVTFILTVAAVGAQAPPAPPVPTPQLDELEQAWLQTYRYAQARAQDACAALVQTKDYDAVRREIVGKAEARRPGYTLDLVRGVLTLKK